MRILVAEDQDHYSRPLVQCLEDSGHRAVVAATAKELHSQIVGEDRIDFLILDLVLGAGRTIHHGLQSISFVRRARPFLPILVFSDHATRQLLDHALELGANAVVRKPPELTRQYYEEILRPEIEKIQRAHAAFDKEACLKRLRSLSEDDLINTVLVPLLRGLGFHDVPAVVHHGPGEFGADIGPFFEMGALGVRFYYGAQVKRVNVSAMASSPGNVNAWLNQASSALTKRFRDADNRLRRLDKVYMITSGKITADARSLLDDYLQRDPRIVVLDGAQIVERLYTAKLIHLLDTQHQSNIIHLVPIMVAGGMHTSWSEVLTAALSHKRSPTARDARLIHDKIVDRERIYSNAFGHGYAFPHVYHAEMQGHVVMLLASERSYPWLVDPWQDVNFLALGVFADEREKSGTIRRVIFGTMGREFEDGPHVGAAARKKLSKVRNSLKDKLSLKSFELDVRRLTTLRI